MQHDWIDVSIAVSAETAVWPGDPHFSARTSKDGGIRVSEINLSVHTGTHIDAPTHYLESGHTVDELPIDATVGPCVVLDLSGAGRSITADELAVFDIPLGSRILLRTENSSRHLVAENGFVRDFASLAPSGAAHLASRNIRCVGIDYLSIGSFNDGAETHRILMNAGIWIIEGLDLRGVSPGEYELICLPLKLVGLEGAPARAIVQRLPESTPEFIDDAVEWASQTG